jgi:hypothetical protein
MLTLLQEVLTFKMPGRAVILCPRQFLQSNKSLIGALNHALYGLKTFKTASKNG